MLWFTYYCRNIGTVSDARIKRVYIKQWRNVAKRDGTSNIAFAIWGIAILAHITLKRKH